MPISATKSHGKRFHTMKKTGVWDLMDKKFSSHHNEA
jgi:hypothetical protein